MIRQNSLTLNRCFGQTEDAFLKRHMKETGGKSAAETYWRCLAEKGDQAPPETGAGNSLEE